MTPDDFLRALWTDTPPGVIQTWELQGKRSSYYRSPHGTTPLAGRTDIYTGVGLAHKDLGRSKRARSNQVIAIAGLWLDLDVDGGPDNKTGAIPSLIDATDIARSFTAPTLLVHSGYGAHAWYLFDEPWRFASKAEQDAAALASAQFYALHRTELTGRGWGLDSTHDLARLLRLPGTINGKGGGRQPVTVLEGDGPRYPRQTLLAIAAHAGDVAVSGPAQLRLDGVETPDVRVPDAGPRPAKLDALLDNVAEFAAAWNHRNARAGWSLSEHDLSIASIAAQATGITDQDLADLIAYHRRLHGDDAKACRLDYLQRTIAKVRAPSERTAAIAHLKARTTRALGKAA